MRDTPVDRARRFAADTGGSLTVEAVIMLPLLLTWFIATFVFFDIFRVNQLNEKAADAITDLITRYDPTADPVMRIDADFIEGMNAVFDQIVANGGRTTIRVTSVGFDGGDPDTTADDRYFAYWSRSTDEGKKPQLTNAQVDALRDRLPILPSGGSQMLVETYIDYQVPLLWGLGLPPVMEFSTFNTMRPRFTTAGESIPFTN